MTEYISDYTMILNENNMGWSTRDVDFLREQLNETLESVYAYEDYDFSELLIPDSDMTNRFEVQNDIELYIKQKYGYDCDTYSRDLESNLYEMNEFYSENDMEFYNDIINQTNKKLSYFDIVPNVDNYNNSVELTITMVGYSDDITDYSVDEVVAEIMTNDYGLFNTSTKPQDYIDELDEDEIEEFVDEWNSLKEKLLYELKLIKHDIQYPILG